MAGIVCREVMKTSNEAEDIKKGTRQKEVNGLRKTVGLLPPMQS